MNRRRPVLWRAVVKCQESSGFSEASNHFGNSSFFPVFRWPFLYFRFTPSKMTISHELWANLRPLWTPRSWAVSTHSPFRKQLEADLTRTNYWQPMWQWLQMFAEDPVLFLAAESKSWVLLLIINFFGTCTEKGFVCSDVENRDFRRQNRPRKAGFLFSLVTKTVVFIPPQSSDCHPPTPTHPPESLPALCTHSKHSQLMGRYSRSKYPDIMLSFF